MKYYQLPTFMPKNTFYNKNFMNSSKNKINNRYYLNNNNRILPLTKPKRIKSLSTTRKQQIKPNANFYLSNVNFYNSSTLPKMDFLEKNSYNNINSNINKNSSKTVPKKNTLYKIKTSDTPLNFKQNLKKIKLLNNANNMENNSYDNKIINSTNKFIHNNYINFNNFDFKPNLNYGNESTLERLLNENYTLYQEAKHSINSFDLISAYGVNTYRGIFRNYNEDRVSIIVNAKNPKKNINNNENNKWPNISFFGIFDGHAGNKCSEYLKYNLHHFIFNSSQFPNFPLKAIELGFKNCENSYMKSIHNKTRNQYSDYSGSCAIIVLIIDDMCYIANLGDSRAIYSYDTGTKFYQLSRDQKPNDPKEKKRIYRAGGSIFKASLSQYGFPFTIKESDLGFKIPFRILPGRLAVSIYLIIQVARAFGDVEAKIPNLGGNPKVLIAQPCITTFRIDEKSDFILIGCKDIFL